MERGLVQHWNIVVPERNWSVNESVKLVEAAIPITFLKEIIKIQVFYYGHNTQDYQIS